MRDPHRARRAAVSAVIALSAVVAACGVPTWNSSLHDADVTPAPAGSNRWLKVHGFEGGLYVLESWEVPDATGPLRGTGVRFDADRTVVDQGAFTIQRDSIALLEANDKEVVSRFGISGLSVYTTVSALATIACLGDPKSCFGSCPTFYADTDADRPLAEGFSSSFARVLEARDVDHLGLTRPPGPFSLVMRNEAQETHAVRHVRMLAVQVPDGDEVLATPEGGFRRSPGRIDAVGCTSEDGACRREIVRRDDVEHASRSDPDDLGRREEVLVDFGVVDGPVGLVLTARHSFVSTYVFYQALAYGGTEVGGVLAALERGDPGVRDQVLGVSRELGGIEVLVRVGEGPFEVVGVFDEAGPIAADQQLFDVGDIRDERVQVKLRMARGSWRLDEVSLARLEEELEPVVLLPDSVEVLSGGSTDALWRLRDAAEHLVTAQGDAYRLWFDVPPGSDHRVFLDSRGYYYEWMRGAWLAEEHALLASSVLHDPRGALRAMAPGFKEVEGRMEGLFWSSRFRR